MTIWDKDVNYSPALAQERLDQPLERAARKKGAVPLNRHADRLIRADSSLVGCWR